MVGRVREKISVRFVKKRRTSSIAFGQDNLIKEHDRRVVLWFSLAFVNEFIKPCENVRQSFEDQEAIAHLEFAAKHSYNRHSHEEGSLKTRPC